MDDEGGPASGTAKFHVKHRAGSAPSRASDRGSNPGY